MNLRQKLALFEKNDFSKSAVLKRVGLDYQCQRSNLYHGIANKIQTLITNIGIIATEKFNDINQYKEIEDRVLKDYGWLQMKYQTIDWDELDREDSDCAVFFEMKILLDDLGRDINTFLNKSRLEFERNIVSNVYQELKQKIQYCNQLMQKFKEIKDRLQKENDSSNRPPMNEEEIRDDQR